MIPTVHLLVASFFFFLKLIIFLACSFKDLQNYFKQSLPLYTLYLFPISLNDDIVDIEQPDRICSPILVLDELLGLFLHPAVFSIKDSRSA